MPPRPSRFTPGLSQEELARGYKRVGSRSPFTRKDVAKALKPYGMKPSKSRRGASDARLVRTAAKAVVKWHIRQQRKKKLAKR